MPDYSDCPSVTLPRLHLSYNFSARLSSPNHIDNDNQRHDNHHDRADLVQPVPAFHLGEVCFVVADARMGPTITFGPFAVGELDDFHVILNVCFHPASFPVRPILSSGCVILTSVYPRSLSTMLKCRGFFCLSCGTCCIRLPRRSSYPYLCLCSMGSLLG